MKTYVQKKRCYNKNKQLHVHRNNPRRYQCCRGYAEADGRKPRNISIISAPEGDIDE